MKVVAHNFVSALTNARTELVDLIKSLNLFAFC